MEKPKIVGWSVKANENGVVMATINRDQLVEMLKYVEYLEQQLKNNVALGDGSKEPKPFFKPMEAYDKAKQLTKGEYIDWWLKEQGRDPKDYP